MLFAFPIRRSSRRPRLHRKQAGRPGGPREKQLGQAAAGGRPIGHRHRHRSLSLVTPEPAQKRSEARGRDRSPLAKARD